MSTKRTFGRAATAALVGILGIVIAMTGCAQQSNYSHSTAEQLQSTVLAVSTSASTSDFAAAVVSLDELEVELKDALAKRRLSQERYESILAAATMVRADLDAAIKAQAPPEVETPTQTTNEGTSNGNDESDDDDNGKEKRNGKGKDKD